MNLTGSQKSKKSKKHDKKYSRKKSGAGSGFNNIAKKSGKGVKQARKRSADTECKQCWPQRYNSKIREFHQACKESPWRVEKDLGRAARAWSLLQYLSNMVCAIQFSKTLVPWRTGGSELQWR